MAAFFPSFRSSSMPKRLLRYALSRLDLLDADALDIDNLDFALGRNTVFEFRDVGIQLKKLDELLQLPAALKLSRAKVLLLRVTVPMDFYTSPITVEVDGVQVKIRVDAAEHTETTADAPASPTAANVVPNTVDLAQSFLDTQPTSERKRLQDALVAETQDLGASVAVSDDGAEEEPQAFGTGQALSLPNFLADFLQGVVDRTQIRIKCVTFQLDMELSAVDTTPSSSSATEPISFQIALGSIEVEGVTSAATVSTASDEKTPTPDPETETTPQPTIVPKQGKRHISLINVRAYLISEANVFTSLSRSLSTTSHSAASSSPHLTRSAPSQQSASLLSRGSFRQQPMASLQESFRERLADRDASPDSIEHRLQDSEEALEIPYDLEDESPPTPRASLMLDGLNISTTGEDSDFHPSISSPSHHEQHHSPPPQPAILHSEFDHGRLPLRLVTPLRPEGADDEVSSASSSERHHPVEDLTQSHLYTHEEAESMYMSAFSTAESEPSTAPAPRLSQSGEECGHQTDETPSPVPTPAPSIAPRSPSSLMPGTWGEESETSPDSKSQQSSRMDGSSHLSTAGEEASSRPTGSWHESQRTPVAACQDYGVQDDVPTPRGQSRIVKEILQLETLSIHVPSHHNHIRVHPTASPQQPPAEKPTQAPTSDIPEAAVLSTSTSEPEAHGVAAATYDRDAVEVLLSPLKICLDASLGLLLARAVGKLLKAVDRATPSATKNTHQRQRGKEENGAFAFRVLAREISLNFLNRSSGIADSPGRHLDPLAFILDHNEEVLLNATLQNLKVSVSPAQISSSTASSERPIAAASQTGVVTKIDLGRFRFGYADGDIISFDSGRAMTTSVRDTFLDEGHDVGIKMIRSTDLSKTDIETLPLVVQLDLQRLDEMIGWFGGLSSFLNMSSSSMNPGASSPAVKSAASPPSLASVPSRKSKPVVHFEAPAADRRSRHSLEHHHPETKNKINLRIGGALVQVMGGECSVVAETNTIKVVGRDEGIGAACGRVRFSGPYMNSDRDTHFPYDSNQPPALMAEVGGLRLELSPVPEDRDLEKLLELIIPSKVKFDDDNGGEIMVETLLRQRRKGSVLRITVEMVNVRVENLPRLSPALPNLGEEIARLSTTVAAKYLPEDDRPGILTLVKLQKLMLRSNVGGRIGVLESQIGDFEVAHISVPSLVAAAIRAISIRRNGTEDLVCSESSPQGTPSTSAEDKGPVIMARIIGDEMEPTVKLKLRCLRAEYRVPTMMDLLGLDKNLTSPHDFEASLAASVASLADHARQPLYRACQTPKADGDTGELQTGQRERPAAFDIGLRDCLLGLNPLSLPSKMVLVLTDARVQATVPPPDGTTTASMQINKASLLLTDDAAETETSRSVGLRSPGSRPRQRRHSATSALSSEVADMCARGFVDICYISSASVTATVRPVYSPDGLVEDGKQVEVELRDDLLVLETCADSTQTLIALVNALKPPTPPSKEDKYRTKVVPVQDLLASISAEAFGKPEGDYDFDHDFAGAQELLAGSVSDVDYGVGGSRLMARADSRIHDEQLDGEELFDATASVSSLLGETTMQDTAEGVLLTGFTPPHTSESQVSDSGDDLVIHENFYGREESAEEGRTAKLWNSAKNTYDRAPDALVRSSPVKMSVRDVHVIWNLFDGYDWTRTRDVIAKAVEDVEAKATERQQQKQRHQQTKLGGAGGVESYEEQDEVEEETIGDFLFNSIYIGVPLNRDPRELTRVINEGLNDDDENVTETESVATATTTTTKTAQRHHHSPSTLGRYGRRRRLRLHRSKHHKITFELRGVSADIVAFPPPEAAGAAHVGCGGQETLSSIDVRVQTLDIFDHVPTSTWKKFATYDQDQGEREMGTNMIHLELLNVRPIPDLAASEIVLRATILPLRLHVDQDALDFITRFFEFKDEQEPPRPPSLPLASAAASDIPFLQRAEVLDIPVKLDFKPKRVDYAGLRSGHTTEFMNFIVLEEARMVLRHVIVYGVSGFDRLGKTLNDIWTPDVRRNQLPGVVAGLAPVRSLVNIGSGFRDLVEIPLKEYRKDGRVVRSISKGAAAFARTTGTELVKLGAKLAVGTQYALQGAEEMLLAERPQRQPRQAAEVASGGVGGGGDYDEDEDLGTLDDEDRKQISLYADQPTGVLQGIRGGYRSLTRDVNLARDAIIAVPGEVIESRTAGGAARAVLRRAPTIIFRPAVGVSKAIGQTLMGATNTIDPENRRRIGEKYKH